MPFNKRQMFAMLYSAAKKFKGLLDTFPGASSAYSLRKLRTSYSGSAIRVRRSTDDAELDIGFNTSGGLDEVALLGHCVPAGTQALYNNIMYFDGVNDCITVSLPVLSGDFSFNLKIVINSHANGQMILASNADRFWISGGFFSFLEGGGAGASFSGINFADLDLCTEYTVTASRTGSTYDLSVDDGVTNLTDQALGGATGNYNFTRIGCSSLGSAYFNGSIYDINIDGASSYIGGGIADSNWEDQIGSNDGTVDGSPVLFTGQGCNGYTTKWYDQTETDDVFNINAASQPAIFLDGATLLDNGKPSLSFTGVEYLKSSTYLVELSANDAVVTSVYHPTTTGNPTGAGYVLSEGDVISAYSSNFILSGISQTAASAVWVNGTDFGTAGTLAQRISGFRKTGGSGTGSRDFRAFYNGATDGIEGSATVNTEVLDISVIGSRADVSTAFFIGTIQEMIIYKEAKTEDLVTDVQDAQNDFYGVY